MISFPSTLNTGGSQVSLPSATPRGIGELLGNLGKSFLNSAVNRVLGGVLSWVHGVGGGDPNSAQSYESSLERIPYDRFRDDDLPTLKPLAGRRPSGRMRVQTKGPTPFWYENSLVANPGIYSVMNTYRYVYDASSLVPVSARKYKDDGNIDENGFGGAEWASGTLSPSLFNPYYGIQRIGPTLNTPLIDTNLVGGKRSFGTDFTDCSINTLCKLSTTTSELGAAKYKYADFMYCKDLGMPNNRLITLRRFTQPVGDMIFGEAAVSADGVYSTPGDVGRLLGYFDTESNKLEDILNYSFHATWEKRDAARQQIESQEDQRESPIGAVLNTMSANYRKNYNESLAAGNNLLDWALDGFFKNDKWYNPMATHPYNYDKNKVYDPIDTVRSTHLYTGVLEFQHEFTLTFDYTLRSYDNINPKAAMLDLLANATAVCYKRGNFWGGRQEIVGAQPNEAGWQKAQNILNSAWDTAGGLFQSIYKNGFNVSAMLSNFADLASDGISKAKSAMAGTGDSTFVADVQHAAGTLITGMTGMLKGKLQNMLGRPQMYLFNSLLSGDNVGLWHVTIGNPRNPIAVMGNLILKDAKIQHYGPLGQDDFPTGLRVIVTLEHARPRDMVDIQKMYTRGIMAIYQHMNAEGAHLNPGSPAGEMYAGENNVAKIKRNVEELS